jgi:hypothetical protein
MSKFGQVVKREKKFKIPKYNISIDAIQFYSRIQDVPPKTFVAHQGSVDLSGEGNNIYSGKCSIRMSLSMGNIRLVSNDDIKSITITYPQNASLRDNIVKLEKEFLSYNLANLPIFYNYHFSTQTDVLFKVETSGNADDGFVQVIFDVHTYTPEIMKGIANINDPRYNYEIVSLYDKTVTNIEGLYSKEKELPDGKVFNNLLRWKQEYSGLTFAIFSAFEQQEKVASLTNKIVLEDVVKNYGCSILPEYYEFYVPKQFGEEITVFIRYSDTTIGPFCCLNDLLNESEFEDYYKFTVYSALVHRSTGVLEFSTDVDVWMKVNKTLLF